MSTLSPSTHKLEMVLLVVILLAFKIGQVVNMEYIPHTGTTASSFVNVKYNDSNVYTGEDDDDNDGRENYACSIWNNEFEVLDDIDRLDRGENVIFLTVGSSVYNAQVAQDIARRLSLKSVKDNVAMKLPAAMTCVDLLTASSGSSSNSNPSRSIQHALKMSGAGMGARQLVVLRGVEGVGRRDRRVLDFAFRLTDSSSSFSSMVLLLAFHTPSGFLPASLHPKTGARAGVGAGHGMDVDEIRYPDSKLDEKFTRLGLQYEEVEGQRQQQRIFSSYWKDQLSALLDAPEVYFNGRAFAGRISRAAVQGEDHDCSAASGGSVSSVQLGQEGVGNAGNTSATSDLLDQYEKAAEDTDKTSYGSIDGNDADELEIKSGVLLLSLEDLCELLSSQSRSQSASSACGPTGAAGTAGAGCAGGGLLSDVLLVAEHVLVPNWRLCLGVAIITALLLALLPPLLLLLLPALRVLLSPPAPKHPLSEDNRTQANLGSGGGDGGRDDGGRDDGGRDDGGGDGGDGDGGRDGGGGGDGNDGDDSDVEADTAAALGEMMTSHCYRVPPNDNYADDAEDEEEEERRGTRQSYWLRSGDRSRSMLSLGNRHSSAQSQLHYQDHIDHNQDHHHHHDDEDDGQNHHHHRHGHHREHHHYSSTSVETHTHVVNSIHPAAAAVSAALATAVATPAVQRLRRILTRGSTGSRSRSGSRGAGQSVERTSHSVEGLRRSSGSSRGVSRRRTGGNDSSDGNGDDSGSSGSSRGVSRRRTGGNDSSDGNDDDSGSSGVGGGVGGRRGSVREVHRTPPSPRAVRSGRGGRGAAATATAAVASVGGADGGDRGDRGRGGGRGGGRETIANSSGNGRRAPGPRVGRTAGTNLVERNNRRRSTGSSGSDRGGGDRGGGGGGDLIGISTRSGARLSY